MRGIYKILNTVNGKFYIGSAVNLQRRKTRHFSELRNGKHNNKHLQAAWNKYGEPAFTFAVVEEVPADADLLAAENIWLAQVVGRADCYNIGVTATAPALGLSGELSPTWGYKHTQEAKEKIAVTGRGRTVSVETRAKRSAKLKGRVISQEQRAQISHTLSGEGNYWYGKKRPEHGEKVSRAIRGYKDGVLQREFVSISMLRMVLEVTPPTVNRALKSGKPITKGKMTGWSFKYVDPTAAP